MRGKLLCLHKPTFMKSMGQFMKVIEKIQTKVADQQQLIQETINRAIKRQENIDLENQKYEQQEEEKKI